ncbi:MAG: hypothetical protein IGR93_22035 [Hydrococcus sp. C42_A2020_068]|nr:hypothetical protein [Hydrococcus sp. C42_A2020_068]
MSKFEELCQAYAAARKDYLESMQMRQDFVNSFVRKMSDYFQCPVEKTDVSFDERGIMYFSILITLYENPSQPEKFASEIVNVSLTLDKILDNYVVVILPWGKEFKLFWDEFNKFEEVYEFIFEKIKEAYTSGITDLSPENKTRNLGWEF